MKNKIMLGFLIATALCFTACGGAEKTKDASTSSISSSSSTSLVSVEDAKGETYDVGDFTVFVPEGWKEVVQYDMFAEEDENGEYPVDTKCIYVVKGAEEELDVFTKPSIAVNLYKDQEAKSQADNTLWLYDDSKEIDVEINGEKVLAYEVTSELSEEEKYVYNVIYIQDGEDTLQFLIPISVGEDMNVNITDEDVIALISGTSINQ